MYVTATQDRVPCNCRDQSHHSCPLYQGEAMPPMLYFVNTVVGHVPLGIVSSVTLSASWSVWVVGS